jgi:hypothetical protein
MNPSSASASQQSLPSKALSALHTYLTTATTTINSSTVSSETYCITPRKKYNQTLAKQILHNLQYQHNWSNLQIFSPESLIKGTPVTANKRNERDGGFLEEEEEEEEEDSHLLISGFPPTRIYIHPDEQIEHISSVAKLRAALELELAKLADAGNQATERTDAPEMNIPVATSVSASTPTTQLELILNPESTATTTTLATRPHQFKEPQEIRTVEEKEEEKGEFTKCNPKIHTLQGQLSRLERSYGTVLRPEIVLPTHIREKWTLRELARVFERLPSDSLSLYSSPEATAPTASTPKPELLQETQNRPRKDARRILLAILNDDSTVVYYFVHEGLVKPRQN